MVNAISVRNCGYIRRLIRFKRVGITSGPLVYFVRFCARHGISGGDLVVNEIQHHCFGVCTGNKILCYGFSNYSLDVRIISFDVLRVFYTYKKGWQLRQPYYIYNRYSVFYFCRSRGQFSLRSCPYLPSLAS